MEYGFNLQAMEKNLVRMCFAQLEGQSLFMDTNTLLITTCHAFCLTTPQRHFFLSTEIFSTFSAKKSVGGHWHFT
jgi:hypothetical protein